MTPADRTDSASSDGGHRARPAPPLLHLCGTAYGLLIHGLRRAPEEWREAETLAR